MACTSCPTCHQHWHCQHYATYELVGPHRKVWQAAKRGFCMIDVVPGTAAFSRPVPGYTTCAGGRRRPRSGDRGQPGDQHRSRRSVLQSGSAGSTSCWNGGDGQAPVPPGNYIIRIHSTAVPLPPSSTGPQPTAGSAGDVPQLLREQLRQQRGGGAHHAPREPPRQDRVRPRRGKTPPTSIRSTNENRPSTSDGK